MRRIILFDIDGTLLSGGPAKSAFCEAMVETYGTAGETETVSFAGKTDPQIARELLATAGLADEDIDKSFDLLWTRYLGYLEERLPADPVRVLPGVGALLDALSAHGDVGVGLLTGNIVGGARLKLGSGGLWDRFSFGSYGSDHEERDALPAIAVGRAQALWGALVNAGNAIVVGDTPRDVACGKAGGTRTLAVATGHFSFEDLQATGADHVLRDLTSTTDVVEVLTG
ncbi:MAG: HAD hydrolase-like protein [Gemmatimonadetes bacterium]|nr:HAD hydrolase-like protein [Gemmatimonadota bacterium]MDA1103254.1 HAD hydrolase-like protein [Gemmatimonadota bacterium]